MAAATRTNPLRSDLAACLWALLAAVLPAGTLSFAQSEPEQRRSAEQAPTDVDQLVRQLSGDSWQERQAAQEQLIRLGWRIEQRLIQLAAQAADEEARMRLQAILRDISEARRIGPSMICLHLKGATPAEVFAALGQQAGAELRPEPYNLWESRPTQRLDLDVEQEPFWQVMRHLCRALDVAPHATAWNRDLVITDASAGVRIVGPAPVYMSGPFLAVAQQVNSHRLVNLHDPGSSTHSSYLQVQIYPEPKIRILQGSYAAEVELAVDELGNALARRQTAPEALQPASNWFWGVSIALSPPPGAGHRIARLKASVKLVIQWRAETVEFTDVLAAKEVTRVVAGHRVTLKEVRQTGDSYLVSLALYRGSLDPATWPAFSRLYGFKLLDSRGQPLVRQPGPGATGGVGDVMLLNLSYRQATGSDLQAGRPAKLLWEVPVESRELTVPFEFSDLPLP